MSLAAPPLAAPSVLIQVDVPAARDTFATAIIDNGEIAGEYDDDRMVSHGFLWTRGVRTVLDAPGSSAFGANTFVTGLNSRGLVVGFTTTSAMFGSRGFMLRHGSYTALTYTTRLRPHTIYNTRAMGTNDRGDIIGYYYPWFIHGIDFWRPPDSRGFIYRRGVYTLLKGPPGCTGVEPHGINNSGDIVGRYEDKNRVSHGFFLHHGILTTLDVPGASATVLTGINDKGDMVGYSDKGPTASSRVDEHAFLLHHGVFTPLNVPGAVVYLGNRYVTEAEALNDKGQIVGNYVDSASRQRGFLLSY